MFIDHLSHGVAKQHDILIEGFNLPLKLDAIHQVDGHRHMLSAQGIEKGVLKKLAFVAHDILRVQKFCCKPAPYHSPDVRRATRTLP